MLRTQENSKPVKNKEFRHRFRITGGVFLIIEFFRPTGTLFGGALQLTLGVLKYQMGFQTCKRRINSGYG